jgi:hypothetical protein
MRVAKLPGAVTIFGERREKSRLPRDVPRGISQILVPGTCNVPFDSSRTQQPIRLQFSRRIEVKRGIWSRMSMLRAVAASAG